jgi:predicted GIY-YIG superfamily endonuclease
MTRERQLKRWARAKKLATTNGDRASDCFAERE